MTLAAKRKLLDRIIREELGKLTFGELLLQAGAEGGIKNSELYHRVRARHAILIAQAELKEKSAAGN